MESTKPKVSVITITYGHEKYIEETLDGVLMQRYDGSVEFIIANDNSPDKTDVVVKDYLANNKIPENFEVKYTSHNKNKGMMHNFIWALQHASGDYIAICEGDDYWTDPLKLQKQVAFLESHEEFSIVSGKAQILKEDKLEDILGDPLNKKDYYFTDFFTKNNLITCTTLFRKTKINFESLENVYFGDWMLYCNILSEHKGKKAKVLDQIFAHYRMHSGGAMARLSHISSTEKHWLQIVEIYKYFKVNYSLQDKHVIKKYAIDLYIYYLKIKSQNKALELAKQCFTLLKLKTPFRTFLSYYRYRNELS